MYRENAEGNDVFAERDALKRENDRLKKMIRVWSIAAFLIWMAYGSSTWQLHMTMKSVGWHFAAFCRLALIGAAALYLWGRSSFLFREGRSFWLRVVLLAIGLMSLMAAVGNLCETIAKLF